MGRSAVLFSSRCWIEYRRLRKLLWAYVEAIQIMKPIQDGAVFSSGLRGK